MGDIVHLLKSLRSKKIAISLDDSGENLRIKGAVAQLTEQDKQQIREQKESLISFFLQQRRSKQEVIKPGPAREKQPLSPAQEGIWLQMVLDPESTAYYIPLIQEIKQTVLDPVVLAQAVEQLVATHELFTYTFTQENGQPCQKVTTVDIAAHFQSDDLSAGSQPAKEAEEAIQKLMGQSEDISLRPPWQIRHFQTGEDTHILCIKIHHLLADGASTYLLLKELLKAYQAISGGTNYTYTGLQYRDYIHWVAGKKQDTEAATYWRKHLGDYEEDFSLPPALAIDEKPGEGTTEITCTIEASLRGQIQQVLKSRQLTLTALFAYAYAAVLGKYARSNDLVIGIPVSGRSRTDLATVIGDMVNTLPMRYRPLAEESLAESLAGWQAQLHDVLRYQDYPLKYILEDIAYLRKNDQHPLFNAVLSVPNNQQLTETEGEIDPGQQQAVYDLTCTVLEYADTLRFSLRGAPGIAGVAELQALAASMQVVIGQLCHEPEKPVAALSLLSAGERENLHSRLSPKGAIAISYPYQSLGVMFESLAVSHPKRVAVSYESQEIPYAKLLQRARQIACVLTRETALSPGKPVVTALEKSPDQLAAMWATWLYGGIYVPIDPSFPEQRKQAIIEDCGASLVIDAHYLAGIPAEADAAFATASVSPEDLAYILYTSGTTGKPKGVAISHGNLLSKLVEDQEMLKTDETIVTLYLSRSIFDASMLETVKPAYHTGKVVIPTDQQMADAPLLQECIVEQEVNTLQVTPTFFAYFIKALGGEVTCGKVLKQINFGAESLPATLVQKTRALLPYTKLNNLYGPTEITIYALAKTNIARFDLNIIGKALPRTEALIVDAYGNPLPALFTGELVVGGPSVAAGAYYEQEALSAQHFGAKVKGSDAHWYVTGDVVRALPGGDHLYVSRKDQQVKYRGYRIELEEISNVARQHPQVSDASVMLHTQSLYLWYTGDAEQEVLQQHLSQYLPDYMWPAALIKLDRLPLTNSGKIDKSQLPLPEAVYQQQNPETDLECQLASCWAEVLHIEEVRDINSSFFALGGNSLSLLQLSNKIKEIFGLNLSMAALFGHTTIAAQSSLIAQTEGQAQQAIEARPRQDYYPLSYEQKRFWFINQLAGSEEAYHINFAHEIKGSLDHALLCKALEQTVARHEILRTQFVELSPGHVVQQVLEAGSVPLPFVYEDLSGKEEKESYEALEGLFASGVTSYQLDRAPLYNVNLLKVGEGRHLLHFSMHHIIGDGWSMGIFFDEVLQHYRLLSTQQGEPLTALAVQYRDYALWQEEYLSQAASPAASYWKDKLRGELPVLHLPEQKNRPLQRSHRGAIHSHTWTLEQTRGFKNFLKASDTTVFAGFYTLVHGLLQRYSGAQDIIIGTPVTGRSQQVLERQLGCYVNTLALRTIATAQDSYATLLQKTKETLQEAFEHQQYPFDLLVEDLQVTRTLSRNPLFDVMLVVEHGPLNARALSAGAAEAFEEVTALEQPHQTSQFDLTFTIAAQEDAFTCHIEYNTDIFTAAFVAQLSSHLAILSEEVVQEASLPLLQHRLPGREVPQVTPLAVQEVSTRFIAKAREQLDAPAIRTGEITISYGQLLASVGALLTKLTGELGVQKGDRIVVDMPRSAEAVVAMWAVWSAGAVYVPVDAGLPEARKAYIVEDSEAVLLLKQEDVTIMDDDKPESLPDAVSIAEDIAYILYTSGTSGKPKGVMVGHKALAVKMEEETRLFADMDQPVAYALTSLAFDVSFLETVYPLLAGGTLVIPGDVQDQQQIIRELSEHRVTILQGTPTYFADFVKVYAKQAEISLPALQYLCIGGESLKPDLLATLRKEIPHVVINNHYGPTEATIDALVRQNVQEIGQNSIGKPLAATLALVLDAQGMPVPDYVQGELHLGGEALAEGYYKDTPLSQKHFYYHHQIGQRLYATGDLASYTEEGEIIFHGRKDQQVKYRGYRIELEEISTVASKLPGINDAYSALHEGQLVLWVVSDTDIGQALRDSLKAQLPAYMLPTHIEQVTMLPRNTNGKVDESRLTISNKAAAPERAATATEKEVIAIWQEVLSTEGIGLYDNFFEHGGHSMLLVRLQAAYEEQFDQRPSLETLFANSTPAAQAQVLTAENETASKILPAPAQDAYLSSYNQQRIWLLSQLEGGSEAYQVPGVHELPAHYDDDALQQAVNVLAERHESLRTVFYMAESGQLMQKVLPAGDMEVPLQRIDLREQNDVQQALEHYLRADLKKEFDLEKGPLYRLILFRVHDDRCVLYYNMHHIICDAESVHIYLSELTAVWEHQQQGKTWEQEAHAIQYKDFAHWQRQADMSVHKAYWQEKASGELPRLDLPGAKARPAKHSYQGKILQLALSQKTQQQLETLAQTEGATLFMTLHAVWDILLYRYTGQRDILTGSPVSLRSQAALQGQIGYFLNTMLLRSQIDPAAGFTSHLQKSKEELLRSFNHQDYPFELLLEDLGQPPVPGRNPLIDILFTYQEQETTTIASDKVVAQLGDTYAKFDIELSCINDQGGLSLLLTYNTDIYTQARMMQVLYHYQSLIASVTEAPLKPVGQLQYLSDKEQQLLKSFTQGRQEQYPAQKPVISLWHEQVAATPNRLVAFDQSGHLSYQEVDKQANQWASVLAEQYGVGRQDRVLLSLPHNTTLLVLLIAVKKLGAVYIPADPDLPQARVDYLYEDSGSKCKLDLATVENLKAFAENAPDTALPSPLPSPEDATFIIYTSGSTGKPKGVLIKSGSVLNRLHWMWSEYPFAQGEVCCAKTSISFVDHIWEIFGPILKGIPLAFYPKALQIDTPAFIEALSRDRVTRIVLVPSLLKSMLAFPQAGKALQHLHTWISSGETLESTLVSSFYALMQNEQVHLINIYGSTELTADATYYDTYEHYNQYRRFALYEADIKSGIDELVEERKKAKKIVAGGVGTTLDSAPFRSVNPEAEMSAAEYSDFLADVVLPQTVNHDHPSYIGHMTGPIPRFVRDMTTLVASLNQNLVKIETSNAATFIERQVIGVLHKLSYKQPEPFYEQHVQHADSSLGIVTNGGTISNIAALSFALIRQLGPVADFAGYAEEGLIPALEAHGYKKAVIIGSAWCHYSFAKALKIMGLGKKAFIALDFENKSDEEIILEAEHLIDQLREEGTLVAAIIGIAGSTEAGMVDPLAVLGGIATRKKVHFHADAAFGGAYLFDEYLKTRLAGIELADSITICAHKQLYLPMGHSVCLFKDPAFAAHAENNTQYQARKGSLDLGRYTLEGSRSFMSLLLHAVLKVCGKEGIAEVLRKNFDNAGLFADLIQASPHFELRFWPDLNIVLYRYTGHNAVSSDGETINQLNEALQQKQFAAGNSFVSFTRIANKQTGKQETWLRAVFMNPYTSIEDLRALLLEQTQIAAEVNKETAISGSDLIPSPMLRAIPIGKALHNVTAYILDEALQMVPLGVTGEIYFAGDCITAGYLNKEDLTRERYLDNPYGAGKIFKTGDLGMWQQDGNILYAGRRDNQIKLNGHRIELDEIRACTREVAGVEDVIITLAGEEGNRAIHAYIIGTAIDELLLKNTWQEKLAYYMIPARYIILASAPLNASGKIDKQQLPALSADKGMQTHKTQPPETGLEKEVAAIWLALLKQDVQDIHADFFMLGGHSLNIAQLAGKYQNKLGKTIPIRQLFEHSTLAGHVQLLKEAAANLAPTIKQTESQPHYPLSANQQRLYILSASEEASAAYNMTYALRYQGMLEFKIIRDALLALIERHEILRTVFILPDDTGTPRQQIQTVDAMRASLATLMKIEEEPLDQNEALSKLNSLFTHLFDLETGPLWKVHILRTEGEWLIGLAMHHIISDGWSIQVFFRDLFSLCATIAKGEKSTLPGLEIQYKDYAVYQQQEAAGQQEARDYWHKEFAAGVPVLELPTQKSRPAIKTYAGAEHRVSLGVPASFHNLCQQEQATPFMGLTALTSILLYKYCGQQELVLGTPAAGRDQEELGQQLGFYATTVPLVLQIDASQAFTDLLDQIRQKVIGAFAHQHYPFDQLVQELGANKDFSRSPLFDVMIVMPTKPAGLYPEEGQTGTDGIETLNLSNATAKYDLSFIYEETAQGLECAIEYNTDLFEADFIKQLSEHLQILLGNICLEPTQHIASLSCLSQEERERLLHGYNQTAVSLPFGESINQMLAKSIAASPETLALQAGTQKLSYAAMEAQTKGMASLLSRQYGISKGLTVGVYMGRSVWSVISMLAIYRLGAIYVPIDNALPEARVQYIIDDADISLLIINETTSGIELSAGREILQIDQNTDLSQNQDVEEVQPAPQDTAYIIYTSGSTGQPKGVVQDYGTLHNLFTWEVEANGLPHSSKYLLFTSFTFDLSLHDALFTLCSSGSLYIATEEQRSDFGLLKELILQEGLETLSIPYSALKAFFEEYKTEHMIGHQIKAIISTGEQLFIVGGLRDFLEEHPHIDLHNIYGPTETHIVTATYLNARTGLPVKASVGKPIYNTQIRILDRDMEPVPQGVNGRVYIGGQNLASGYRNKPELTEQLFIQDPYAAGATVYDSGDVARWLPGGEIEYLHRADGQVKIRGYRVEIGEIEAIINGHEQVEGAVVKTIEVGGGTFLAAYYLSKSEIGEQVLRAALEARLPEYMVPTWIYHLPKFPITVNGKVDKKQLPQPDIDSLRTHTPYKAPADEYEHYLVAVWQELLQLDKIGTEDDLFALGIHSLLVVRAQNKIKQTYHVKIDLKEVFHKPTISAIAEQLRLSIWAIEGQQNTTEIENAEDFSF